jgi:hypothetical protein
MTTMNMHPERPAFYLDPEFWKLLLVGASIALSPVVHHVLMSKYSRPTVYLFGACLPTIPVMTYRAGLGPVHLLCTPLLVMASLVVCVSLTNLVNLCWRCVVDLFRRVVSFCVASVCHAILWVLMPVVNVIRRAISWFVSLLLAFRFWTMALIVAASVAFPPLGIVLMAGLFLWVGYQVARVIGNLVRGFIALIAAANARATAGVEALNAAACRKVQVAKDAVVVSSGRALSSIRSVLATMIWWAVSTLLWTLTLLLMMLALYLKTASMVHFLVDPSAETFAVALAIKVTVAIFKCLAGKWRG